MIAYNHKKTDYLGGRWPYLYAVTPTPSTVTLDVTSTRGFERICYTWSNSMTDADVRRLFLKIRKRRDEALEVLYGESVLAMVRNYELCGLEVPTSALRIYDISGNPYKISTLSFVQLVEYEGSPAFKYREHYLPFKSKKGALSAYRSARSFLAKDFKISEGAELKDELNTDLLKSVLEHEDPCLRVRQLTALSKAFQQTTMFNSFAANYSKTLQEVRALDIVDEVDADTLSNLSGTFRVRT